MVHVIQTKRTRFVDEIFSSHPRWLGIRAGGERSNADWETDLGRVVDTWGSDLTGRVQVDGFTLQASQATSQAQAIPNSRTINFIWDLPQFEGGEPVTLDTVVLGQWDTEITTVTQNLIDNGHPHAHLRLMHEADLAFKHFTFRNGNGPAFRDAWQRIHTIVMNLTGAQFKWEFDVNGDGKNQSLTETDAELGTASLLDIGYAGSLYVDDISNGSYFRGSTDGPSLLVSKMAENEYVRDYAISKGKKYSMPEWGMWNDPNNVIATPGDYPDFIQAVYDLFANLSSTDRGTLQYFNITNQSDLNGTLFPESEELFFELFEANP